MIVLYLVIHKFNFYSPPNIVKSYTIQGPFSHFMANFVFLDETKWR